MSQSSVSQATAPPSPASVRTLLDAVVAVGSDLHLSEVLTRIVRSACDLVDAEYGALGVLGPGGDEVVEFIVEGISAHQRDVIGDPPKGAGILGLLVREPHPLRLPDLTKHPAFRGFPPGHPPMRSFLGAPVRVRGEVFGNLYLTEKRGGGAFTDNDEAIVTTLAAATGVAIDNARIYEGSRRRRQWADAVSQMTRALLDGADEHAAIDVLAAQAATVSGAESAVVALTQDDGAVVIAAATGPDPEAAAHLIGTELTEPVWTQVADSHPRLVAGHRGRPVDPATVNLRRATGLPGAGPTVIVPMSVGARWVGLLIVAWGEESLSRAFDAIEPLSGYAAQAALTLAAASSRRDRARAALLEDRERIARDMHDVVIQRLYAAGLSLQSVGDQDASPTARARVDHAVDELDVAVKELRTAIFHLHESRDLDHPLVEIKALVAMFRRSLGFTPQLTVAGDLADLDDELLGHIVGVVREGLANISRHAEATKATVRIALRPDRVRVRIADNGVGMPDTVTRRSGLANLEARALESHGSLEVVSTRGEGTRLIWTAVRPLAG